MAGAAAGAEGDWGGRRDGGAAEAGASVEWEEGETPWWLDKDLQDDPSLGWAEAEAEVEVDGEDADPSAAASDGHGGFFVPGQLWIPDRHYGLDVAWGGGGQGDGDDDDFSSAPPEFQAGVAALAEAFQGVRVGELAAALRAHGGDAEAAAEALATGAWPAPGGWGDGEEGAPAEPPAPPAIDDPESFPELGGGGGPAPGGAGWGGGAPRGAAGGGFAAVLQRSGAAGGPAAAAAPHPSGIASAGRASLRSASAAAERRARGERTPPPTPHPPPLSAALPDFRPPSSSPPIPPHTRTA